MEAPITSIQHLNGDLLCVCDTETTGLRGDWHDMIQIALVPLNGSLEPMLNPFYITIKPEHPNRTNPQAMKVNKIKFVGNEPDKWDSQAIFENWFEKTVTANRFKKIQLVGQNLNFDIPFIEHWMDYDMEKHEMSNALSFFNFSYIRDTKRAAEFLNDLAYFNGQDQPFSKTSLSYLCNRFNIDNTGAHDALADALMTAKVYKCLLSLRIGNMDFGAKD